MCFISFSEAEMSQRAVEPAIASKLEYAKEQNKEIAAVMRELELVSTVMAQTKALEGGNKSASWDLSSAQKQAEEADKNLMYARQRMRDVKEREAETRVKVCTILYFSITFVSLFCRQFYLIFFWKGSIYP